MERNEYPNLIILFTKNFAYKSNIKTMILDGLLNEMRKTVTVCSISKRPPHHVDQHLKSTNLNDNMVGWATFCSIIFHMYSKRVLYQSTIKRGAQLSSGVTLEQQLQLPHFSCSFLTAKSVHSHHLSRTYFLYCHSFYVAINSNQSVPDSWN